MLLCYCAARLCSSPNYIERQQAARPHENVYPHRACPVMRVGLGASISSPSHGVNVSLLNTEQAASADPGDQTITSLSRRILGTREHELLGTATLARDQLPGKHISFRIYPASIPPSSISVLRALQPKHDNPHHIATTAACAAPPPPEITEAAGQSVVPVLERRRSLGPTVTTASRQSPAMQNNNQPPSHLVTQHQYQNMLQRLEAAAAEAHPRPREDIDAYLNAQSQYYDPKTIHNGINDRESWVQSTSTSSTLHPPSTVPAYSTAYPSSSLPPFTMQPNQTYNYDSYYPPSSTESTPPNGLTSTTGGSFYPPSSTESTPPNGFIPYYNPQPQSYPALSPYPGQSSNSPLSPTAGGFSDPEAEQKRLRNTAASARFRAKKKKREQSLERASQEKRALVSRLEGRVKELEEENKWLKDLVWEKRERDDRRLGRRKDDEEDDEEEEGEGDEIYTPGRDECGWYFNDELGLCMRCDYLRYTYARPMARSGITILDTEFCLRDNDTPSRLINPKATKKDELSLCDNNTADRLLPEQPSNSNTTTIPKLLQRRIIDAGQRIQILLSLPDQYTNTITKATSLSHDC
ncbi:hypothetical protein G7Y89_g3899 [Cudoniella acicularis]|uniref:BZIP domain-containing protein n=1 Tax=Cudoniella acicularis TaxID=354080 RepID=A0A8H4RQG7_9HELO|nr:hypothetical protein G7Y89_g3899 [Cudoniella acicularis]